MNSSSLGNTVVAEVHMVLQNQVLNWWNPWQCRQAKPNAVIGSPSTVRSRPPVQRGGWRAPALWLNDDPRDRTDYEAQTANRLPFSSLREEPRERCASSDKQLDPLADGLSADGAGFERGAAVDAGGVAALEHQLDVVIDADGARDALLHLPVARLQLLQQVVLLWVLRAGAALHLRLVWFQEMEMFKALKLK